MGMMTRHNQKARAAQTALAKKKTVEVKPIAEELKNEIPQEEKIFYTKTDINTMKVADLRELAKQKGIENADDISGTELKNILIEKMGL